MRVSNTFDGNTRNILQTLANPETCRAGFPVDEYGRCHVNVLSLKKSLTTVQNHVSGSS